MIYLDAVEGGNGQPIVFCCALAAALDGLRIAVDKMAAGELDRTPAASGASGIAIAGREIEWGEREGHQMPGSSS
ncbi:MAG: hypothetical protein P0Y64_16680 [Candidatus Sphingomonas colombiensis]|nr:hypothetical protein [Sphingomonas sp.]WEK42955.1 MAG: hypothetical protein P0Y64_16680 [Sphingomonas sp.]